MLIRSLPADSTNLMQCLERARGWLQSAFLRKDDLAGWGHYRGESEPTVWGTSDGVRAMLRLGVPPLSPDLSDAVAWLKAQQRADGGFGTRELNYSSAEATSWVVITLAQLGLTSDTDPWVRRAVDYLESCVDVRGGAATTPQDFDEPRTLPTALALWALSLQPRTHHVCGLLVDRLRSVQDPDSRGWGVKFGAPPNAANTAQVLHALRQAGVSAEAEWLQAGARYLTERQKPNGSWRNSHDEWFTKATPRIPYRCTHFATGWALLALLDFDTRPCRQAASRAVRHLMETQRPDGAWLYEEFDPAEHVWSVCQAVVALATWKERQHPRLEPIRKRARVRFKTFGDIAVLLLNMLRGSVIYIAVAILTVMQFEEFFGKMIGWTVRTINVDRHELATNLVSSALWAGFILGLSLLAKKIRGGNR